MNETPLTHPALLPAGLRDVLPPEAELEARSVGAIMDCFAAHGYQRVAAPLIEFEDSLFAGSGAATAEQTFRLMDPDSQHMMGLRADITPQIARLATTRLAAAPRPLRLTYSGQCLRVRGSHLQPERQISQAGIELIGPDTAEADAEIILTAVAALAEIGIWHQRGPHRAAPRDASAGNRRRTRPPAPRPRAGPQGRGGGHRDGEPLARHCWTCWTRPERERAIPALLAIDLPEEPKLQAQRIAETVAVLRRRQPDLQITVDPVEFRSYQYHTGLCMTLFALGEQAELGRGGRYLCGDTEAATGITLYPDTIVRVAPPQPLRPRLYLPYGTPAATAAEYRAQNYATVAGLAPHPSPRTRRRGLAALMCFRTGRSPRYIKDKT